jgi:hypothetical protein
MQVYEANGEQRTVASMAGSTRDKPATTAPPEAEADGPGPRGHSHSGDYNLHSSCALDPLSAAQLVCTEAIRLCYPASLPAPQQTMGYPPPSPLIELARDPHECCAASFEITKEKEVLQLQVLSEGREAMETKEGLERPLRTKRAGW